MNIHESDSITYTDTIAQLIEKDISDQQIRLQFGEMTAAEMRTARAIIAWHERQVAA